MAAGRSEAAGGGGRRAQGQPDSRWARAGAATGRRHKGEGRLRHSRACGEIELAAIGRGGDCERDDGAVAGRWRKHRARKGPSALASVWIGGARQGGGGARRQGNRGTGEWAAAVSEERAREMGRGRKLISFHI